MDRIKAHRSAPDVYDPPTFDQMADRIEQLERERDAALAAQDYTYIGKDMKPILARDLEDAKDAAEAKLAKAVEALRPFADVLKGNYSHQPDTMPISMGFGEYDRRLALKLMDFRNARAMLAELEGEE
jgi:hypothetical protein